MSKRSELEGGFQKSTEVIEGLGGRAIKVVGSEAKWTAEVVKRWSHRDVVCNLELVPPLPCIVAIGNVIAAAIDVGVVLPGGYESWLTNSHAKGVALDEGISPLKTDVPGL